jgi:ring-1,2-phenylacetyl-CoA epoxidase subunit PaaC
LAKVAVKLKSELKYHVLHANTMIRQLGTATPESIARLQKALEEALPYAVGIFEPSVLEEEIIQEGIFSGERRLQQAWQEKIENILQLTALRLPDWQSLTPRYGGRAGNHTSYLAPLLAEMTEVYNLDPTAEW